MQTGTQPAPFHSLLTGSCGPRRWRPYTRSVLEPLVAALERSQARVAEPEREAGSYAEQIAGLERVRDAAMVHAAEVEAQLTEPPEPAPAPAPDPFPQPIPPTPTPNAAPRWRRWLGRVMLSE